MICFCLRNTKIIASLGILVLKISIKLKSITVSWQIYQIYKQITIIYCKLSISNSELKISFKIHNIYIHNLLNILLPPLTPRKLHKTTILTIPIYCFQIKFNSIAELPSNLEIAHENALFIWTCQLPFRLFLLSFAHYYYHYNYCFHFLLTWRPDILLTN